MIFHDLLDLLNCYCLLFLVNLLLSELVALRILNKIVHNVTLWIISPVLNFIACYLGKPNVVLLRKGIEYIQTRIWITHLWNNCAIGSISHIDCTILFRITSNQWFCSFKGMYMVFKDCHYFVFVEIRYPMEQSIQKSLRTLVEPLTDTIDWNMIINKLKFVFVRFEGVYHKAFLISKLLK